MSTCKWPLGNGEDLEFTIYGPNTSWHEAAGLYIFACMGEQDLWCALYVGQTDNFCARIPTHELIEDAVRYGATHIHAKVVPDASEREKWEKMLIEHLQPPLNVQNR